VSRVLPSGSIYTITLLGIAGAKQSDMRSIARCADFFSCVGTVRIIALRIDPDASRSVCSMHGWPSGTVQSCIQRVALVTPRSGSTGPPTPAHALVKCNWAVALHHIQSHIPLPANGPRQRIFEGGASCGIFGSHFACAQLSPPSNVHPSAGALP
jgi:hypothetical protein